MFDDLTFIPLVVVSKQYMGFFKSIMSQKAAELIHYFDSIHVETISNINPR